METQKTITAWANETFGEPETNLSIATRALLEYAELVQKILDATRVPDHHALQPAAAALGQIAKLLHVLAKDHREPDGVAWDDVVEEGADVLIVLMRMFERCGVEASAAVDHKMTINRGRKWVKTGGGHGQHVKICGARPAGGDGSVWCELPKHHDGLHEGDGAAFSRTKRRKKS